MLTVLRQIKRWSYKILSAISGLEWIQSHCCHGFIGDLSAVKEDIAAQHLFAVVVFALYMSDVSVVRDSGLEESGRPDLSLGEMWAQAPVSALLDWVQPSYPLQYIYL